MIWMRQTENMGKMESAFVTLFPVMVARERIYIYVYLSYRKMGVSDGVVKMKRVMSIPMFHSLTRPPIQSSLERLGSGLRLSSYVCLIQILTSLANSID